MHEKISLHIVVQKIYYEKFQVEDLKGIANSTIRQTTGI
jgi:hypothetical protein